MRRFHLFEFHDLAICPPSWRAMLTDILSFFALRFRVFGPIVPRLTRVARELGAPRLVDLCSGSGGPAVAVAGELAAAGEMPLSIVLTDKFPNREAFRRAVDAAGPCLSYVLTAVDATSVPPELSGLRTLFASFHHFEPATARAILADAVETSQGIGIFEYTERNLWIWGLPIVLIPAFAWFATPFLRPVSWRRLLWTYLVPVIPLIAMWDGLVSCLRTYTVDELRALTEFPGAAGYRWEIGRIRSLGACRVTYLLGQPLATAAMSNCPPADCEGRRPGRPPVS
ncbi:MAG: class I SAM-dependent methyltransferase [Acidobacteriota bacterium]